MVIEKNIEQKTCSSISLEEAKNYINSLNFDQIIAKMQREEWWSGKQIIEISQQYRHFLFLMKKYGDQYGLFSPTKEIDMFWHNHILDTQNYIKDCLAIFGYYLHHYPFLSKNKLANTKKKFNFLQELHVQEFGDYLYEVHRGRFKYFIKTLLKIFNKHFI